MKIIVGLGNPGLEYRHTRHNVGFMVLDQVAAQLGAAFARERRQGLLASATYQDERVLLVKPVTYMNRSGECVGQVLRYEAAALADLLVVADDAALPLGKLRLRSAGTAGGHNGLRSIIDHLGTDEFPRLRLGVGEGNAEGGLVDHVLGRFMADEVPQRDDMVTRAADAVLSFIGEGIERAMNRFN